MATTLASKTAKQGPTLNLKLHKVQGRVFQSMAQEILYGGAAGGGKSFLLRAAAIVWAMQIPGLQVYLFRRQFPDLEKNHLQGPTSFPILLQDMIEKGYVIWNRTKFKFTFWNGSVIHLCHCQKEDDRYNYLGAEIHVLLIDELSQFTPVIYRFLRTRVRMIGISVPPSVVGKFPRIVCGSNPGGPCHNYMKAGWVDCAPAFSVFQAPEDEGGMSRQFIPARIADNPALVREDPAYAGRIKGLGDPALVKAYLEGDFSVISGGMFDDLWSPSVHILKPFRIPSTWYIDRAMDWGSSKPFAIGWFAESDGSRVDIGGGRFRTFPEGTIFQIGEWYGWNGRPDEGLKLTARKVAEGIVAIEERMGVPVMPGPADSMIFDIDEEDSSIAGKMQDVGVDWLPADKSPGSRKLGIEEIRTRLAACIPERDEDQNLLPLEHPGFYIFQNCYHTARTLPVLQRADNDSDDIKQRQEDHVFDKIRYRLRHSKQLVTGSDFRAF